MDPTRRDRIRTAIAVAAVHGVLGYALLAGLAVRLPTVVEPKRFVLTPPLPAARPPPRRAVRPKPAARAAPPNRTAKPVPFVSPLPVVPPVVPPPVDAAPVAGTGDEAIAGATLAPGPGTGSAGEGTGTASGGDGAGDGGGTPPRWLRGRIRDSDYPEAALAAGAAGGLTTRYVIGSDGRVTACSVTRSSGSADLDDTTCRLVQKRFRYVPARDPDGRRVPGVVTETHRWVIEP